MKKYFLIVLMLLLAGCSAQQTPSSLGAPIYDMNAVQAYQVRVASGNTVTEQQKVRALSREDAPMPLNGSDHKPAKTSSSVPATISIVPAIGVGYYHGFGRHYW